MQNYAYVPFGELFKWGEKSHIKSGDGKKIGKYKLFVCSDVEVKRYDNYLLDGEALVFGTGGKASCHYVNEPFSYSTDCVVALKKRDDIFAKFYYYYLRRGWMLELQETFSGSGLQHTSKRKIEKLLVPHIDYDEQVKIVSRIEELFSMLDDSWMMLKRIEQQLIVYRKAILKQAFEGFSDEIKKSIESICDKVVDCPHSTPKWETEGKICLRTTNFKRGYLDMSEQNYVSQETFDKRNRRLIPKPGDVLFSREGAILGIACIIPENMEVCLGQRMMLLRTSTCLNNKFLMHYLNSPIANKLVVENVGGTAAPHINVGDIKEFLIPVPDMEEQMKIVNDIEGKLSVCDDIQKTVELALKQVDVMRQSILKDAFEGRL